MSADAPAATAGSGPKRRRIQDGFAEEGGTGGQYWGVAPKMGMVRKCFLMPSSSLQDTSSITFDLQTADNEVVRFPEDCVNIVFTLKCANPAYNAAAVAGLEMPTRGPRPSCPPST
jgi:hypothetical protein